MKKNEIIGKLPYSRPFLFADGIDEVSEKGITGHYTFPENSFFYEGHFVNFPVTPGVILTECMAQIGLVCLGIFLLDSKDYDLRANASVAMAESHVQFFAPVYPKEKVTVISELEYFRLGKLKCKVKMINAKKDRVCSGILSGILIPDESK